MFLLDQVVHVYWMEFGRTWPALLIVIGLVMFLQHNAPAAGHVPREYHGSASGAAGSTVATAGAAVASAGAASAAATDIRSIHGKR